MQLGGVGIFLLLAGFAWTAVFMIIHFRWALQARAARRWPVAEARIVDCRIECLNANGVLKYAPKIAYSYAVAGENYQGDRVRFGDVWSIGPRKAEAIAGRYSPGGRASVHYDPNAPEESVLEPAAPKRTFLYLSLLGLFFMAGGLAPVLTRSPPPPPYPDALYPDRPPGG